MTRPVLLDTSVIVSLLDHSQKYHRICTETVDGLDRPLVTCEAVVTEACYLLRHQPRAVEAILANVARAIFQLPLHLAESATAISSLMQKYGVLQPDFADACLIHLADELDQGDILTLDHDFEVYRWRRNRPFHLLLELTGNGS